MLKESERAVIQSFILEPKRRRLLELMQSAKGRKKLRSSFAHFAGFDPATILPLPPNQQHASSILHMLAELGAPSVCSLISESADWDGLDMDLKGVLEEIVGCEYVTIVNCVPGVLAYFEGEEPKHRFILRKTS